MLYICQDTVASSKQGLHHIKSTNITLVREFGVKSDIFRKKKKFHKLSYQYSSHPGI